MEGITKHTFLILKKAKYYINDADLEDIVQSAYLKLCKFKDSYGIDTYNKELGMLIMISKQLIANRYRSRSPLENKNEDEINLDYIHDETINPELNHLRYELLHKIKPLLNERQYEIFILRYYNGVKYEVISERLNINIGTVKSVLFHVHKAIRKNIEKEELIF